MTTCSNNPLSEQ